MSLLPHFPFAADDEEARVLFCAVIDFSTCPPGSGSCHSSSASDCVPAKSSAPSMSRAGVPCRGARSMAEGRKLPPLMESRARSTRARSIWSTISATRRSSSDCSEVRESVAGKTAQKM